MNRILSRVIIAFLLFTLAACGAKTSPAKAEIQGKTILSVLKDLKSAYEAKDIESFLSRFSGSYPDRQAFTASVGGVFRKFAAIRFNIQYRKMLVMVSDKGPIKAVLNWDAEWQTAGGNVQKDGGRVTLAFDPKESKLISIEGKNPFVPQPQEIQGKQ